MRCSTCFVPISLCSIPSHPSLLAPNVSQFHPPHRPDLPLILLLISSQPQSSTALPTIFPSSFRLGALPRLSRQPERDPLEVVPHGPLDRRLQRIPTGWGSHVPIEEIRVAVHGGEECEESLFRRQLDGDEGVAGAAEHRRREERQVRGDEGFAVVPRCGTKDHERQPAGVDRGGGGRGREDGGQGFYDREEVGGGFVGGWGEEVFACC